MTIKEILTQFDRIHLTSVLIRYLEKEQIK